MSFEYTADLQATSTFPFHFHFHGLDAPALERVIRRMSKRWRDVWNWVRPEADALGIG